jgi:hypothetical protein
MGSRRTATVVVAVGLLLISLLGASTAGASTTDSTAARYVCGRSWPEVAGAKAEWTAYCDSNGILVNGWVEDTRADNRCAYTYGYYPNQWSPLACPKGTRKWFDFYFPVECCRFTIELWTKPAG